MPIDLKAFIRDVPDFPQPGVLFRDITPLLHDTAAFRHVIELPILVPELAVAHKRRDQGVTGFQAFVIEIKRCLAQEIPKQYNVFLDAGIFGVRDLHCVCNTGQFCSRHHRKSPRKPTETSPLRSSAHTSLSTIQVASASSIPGSAPRWP